MKRSDDNTCCVAELKSIDFYHGSLKTYAPDASAPFEFQVTLLVGPKGQLGEELFVVTICNALALAEEAKRGPVFGAGRLIVTNFEYDQFRRTVEAYCARCTGETWTEVALKVSRLGAWEFGDHVVLNRSNRS